MQRAPIKSATILYAFDNVLKSPDPYILKSIKVKYRKEFEGFVDLSLLDALDDVALFYMTLGRTVKNPLQWISTREYDYDKFYKRIDSKLQGLYKESTELNMFKSLRAFSKSYCIDMNYVWNEEYDERQHRELNEIIEAGGKIKYVVGPFEKVLDDIGKVNIVFDWDLDRVHHAMTSNHYEDIFFGLASYPFNLSDERYAQLKKRYYNLATFPVYDKPIEDLYVG